MILGIMDLVLSLDKTKPITKYKVIKPEILAAPNTLLKSSIS